ncbi:helix-turn-helix transcriptional regulator [Myroides odoratimimus]|uniref:helix-turn-helix domain-containing protein n=1 Tax=Myroides odoratimimus TaxID=76832 RepID=UPI002098468E|nr:AraC family transcriptional regulator [Myroides odoratimimus]MCO7723791.1 AraC family transcriptional regulator [Myroides odoratimimus]MDM1466481.1 helix-turn-helix transcriptional regulator [Myroides odoratimimus]MDM1469631.1 helix-turn-helix transcriptional regulator [Myroides odoratimimus]MDM1479643.1 helix-turn-helix transcriptional regulator [Myroides odoratimimus]MDM1506909.1 helix-turn-helix transcriptional regulator [Myroides odoratimimus]
MRLDLIKDFSGVLQQCFSMFLEGLNDKTVNTLDHRLLQHACFVFDKLLYFVCAKKYFGLNLKLYQNPDAKSFVVIKKQSAKWDISGMIKSDELFGLENSEIINWLKTTTSNDVLSFKKVISQVIIKDSNAILLLGFSINTSSVNQVFYIWGIRVKIKSIPSGNILISKQQREVYKRYYQDYCFLKQESPSISLKWFTQEINMHPKTFQRNFKKYLGTSFYDYHIQNRLIESLLLLMFSSYSVSEIAYKCGYESYRGYLRAFNKDQKYQPLYYRNL